MAKYSKTIQDLERVDRYLDKTIPENEVKEASPWLSTGFAIYELYYDINEQQETDPEVARDHLIVSPQTFQEHFTRSELRKLINFFTSLNQEKAQKEPEKEKVPPPPKEEISIPADLKERVEEYKRVQASKIEEDEEHTVAGAVKRARNTWLARREKELIRENRLKQIEDSQGLEARQRQEELEADQRDRFLIETVKPKAESAGSLSRNLELHLKEAVLYQNPELNATEVNKLVDQLSYLSYTGAIDLQSDSDLYVATQLAFKDLGLPINPTLNTLDEYVTSQNNALQTDPYSDKADQIENNIISTDEEIRDLIRNETQDLSEKIKAKYPDFIDHRDDALIEVNNIQTKLIQAIPVTPSPQSNPAAGIATDLENSLRGIDKDLRVNSGGLGKRAEELIRITGSNNQKISAESVRLFSIGLTAEKFSKHIEFAKANPDSDIGKLYKANKNVFDQVHYQLGQISGSKLGSDINKELRPVGAIDRFYNNLNPTARGILKLAVDPKGTVTSWANGVIGRQIGRRLVENGGSVIVQKLGNFLLKEGLEQGVKTFAKEAAKKVAVEVAKKIGITLVGDSLVASLALALGIPTAGISLIIGALLIVGQFILDKTIGFAKKQVDKVWVQLYGEEYDWKKAALAAGSFGVAAAGTGAALVGGFITTVTVTRAAVISMVGAIVTSALIVMFYVGLTFLVAPILSTLVQLDSVEKVKYEDYSTVISSSECGWPTAGHYVIVTGPVGGTHYRSKLQAIDIGAPDLSEHLSGTDGVVSYTGPFRNYGNTVIVETTNKAGSFKVYYGHLSKFSVGKGKQVKIGDKIGLVGGSGGWPPHIHMEYDGIKYNQCPAGGLQIKEGCCIPYPGGICTGLCNAYSN